MLSSYLFAAAMAGLVAASPVEQSLSSNSIVARTPPGDNSNWNYNFQTTNDDQTAPGPISGHGPRSCVDTPTSKAQGITGSSDAYSNLHLCIYTKPGCNKADLCGNLGDIEDGSDGETACYTNNLYFVRSYEISSDCA